MKTKKSKKQENESKGSASGCSPDNLHGMLEMMKNCCPDRITDCSNMMEAMKNQSCCGTMAENASKKSCC
jgi:hypothetical protein